MANSPNGGLINETNEQYYVGTQSNIASSTAGVLDNMVFTFNEVLHLASWDPTDPNYNLNNFVLEWSVDGLQNWNLWNGNIIPGGGTGGSYTISKFSNVTPYSTLSFTNPDAIPDGYYVRVKLKSDLVDGAPNYGDYQYISIFDVVNNFMMAYVGGDKIIPKAKRSDVVFHAKRGLQEFSYDTLRSIKSQELTIPPSLSVIIPQDYVNYVNLSWVDESGIKHIIYPTTLTSNPTETPIQDTNITTNPFGFNFPSSGYGIPTQDSDGNNLESTSLTEEAWANLPKDQNVAVDPIFETGLGRSIVSDMEVGLLGQRYGLKPELSQSNGWFTINKREGKFSFSSNLAGKLILLDYISDGLAYEEDTKVPKLAEEALYMHIAYSILSTTRNIPEFTVQRFKKDRRAQLRNAKIRLSNIKLDEFVQIMRGKSKWIKY
jgi:hypothetical protein|tara:strand:+ start:31 stop:1326 length:1296 start_codon:yes stop_codon:yes gene_type:complete